LNREYFILEKDGIPVAGIMNVDELEDYLPEESRGVSSWEGTGCQQIPRWTAARSCQIQGVKHANGWQVSSCHEADV